MAIVNDKSYTAKVIMYTKNISFSTLDNDFSGIWKYETIQYINNPIDGISIYFLILMCINSVNKVKTNNL